MPPSDTRARILDAAETRIRRDGYHGFSFRDIAADVGVKSASVHHHFATKESLGAAVATRYADRFIAGVRAEAAERGDVVARFTEAFRSALREDGQMCLCGVLGAEMGGLPELVAASARGFFNASIAFLTAPDGGALSHAAAVGLIARLEGAMLLGRVMGDHDLFDLAAIGQTQP